MERLLGTNMTCLTGGHRLWIRKLRYQSLFFNGFVHSRIYTLASNSHGIPKTESVLLCSEGSRAEQIVLLLDMLFQETM